MSRKKSLFFVSTLVLLLLPLTLCGIRLNQTLPDNIAVAKDSVCSIKIGKLVSTKLSPNETSLASSADKDVFTKEENGNLTLFTEAVGRYDIELKFLGVLPIKKMSVDVLEGDMVIPGGDVIGIKIHTEGVLVVKLSSVETDDGQKLTPAKDAGLKEGDIIMTLDGIKIKNTDHFAKLVNEKGGQDVELEFVRETQTHKIKVGSAFGAGSYKIGAWIRDSTAGIGTLTFINPNTGVFGSLGHGISDADTNLLLNVAHGSITDCRVVSVERGQKGTPGELRGVFEGNDIGVIEKNSKVGVYGVLLEKSYSGKKPMKIASRFEVQQASATILATVDEKGPLEYSIEIEKVMTNSTDEKGMIIKIVDESLLSKTGGIVQGMSGSPIIQNGKLVGAVTHVLVNDPTRGYGIFIENMLDEAL